MFICFRTEREASSLYASLPVLLILDLGTKLDTESPREQLSGKIHEVLVQQKIPPEKIEQLLKDSAILNAKIQFVLHLLFSEHFTPSVDVGLLFPPPHGKTPLEN